MFSYKTNFFSDILVAAGVTSSSLPSEGSDMMASYYFRQAYDSKGNLYACFNLSSEIFQFNSKGFRSLPHAPARAIYSALYTMPNDEIWAFDQVSTGWYFWKDPDALPQKIQLDKENMQAIELADAKFIGGFTWLSTYAHGLLQYKGNKRINHFAGVQRNGIMPKTLTEICSDPADKNKFWIGSRGGGLILWDVQKGLQKIYTSDDGLPNNTIYCIVPDKAGNLWGSTNKGIFRFNVELERITAFDRSDGLSGNEFNRAHKFVFPDGRLAFGGLEGYTIFDPADFNRNNKTGDVPVLLTGLQINNQVQDVSLAGSVVTEPLSTLSVIDIPYNKNYLRFEFAAVLFNQPQKTKYRYQLKGSDAGWIENGTNKIAAYSSLVPGKYTLRINATDNNGFWSDSVKEVVVVIHPPIWATWWAYLVYTFVVVGLIRWYFIFRERRIEIAQNLAFEKREALRLKEGDEMKDRFFSNVTHEFRTPLTLIITPLEKLVQDPSLSQTAVSTIKTVQRNSRQLLKLINELLDFSRLNKGQLKLRLSTGELNLFVASCVQSFEAGAKEKNIQLSFATVGTEGFYSFDEDKWETIITNLVGNALKFTPQNGTVAVLLSSTPQGTIQLEVTDNGPGIPYDQQQKIFDRFYQVNNSSIRSFDGTGIELSLVKELTGLMHGTVLVDSKPGGLTRFMVEMPVKKVASNENFIPVSKVPVEKQPKNSKEEEVPLLLLVEDNDELRAFLGESMATQYRIIEEADGVKAWETILQELPDIVISDVMMPGQDGFDLCRMCKTDNRTAHIGFILLTAKAAHEARVKGLLIGADDYITKPFNLEELALRTSNLLQMQQRLRAFLNAQLIGKAPQQQLPTITDS
ncbi:MAG: ATP-binding protein, partial [Chitinophagaceae bacterium]